MSYFEKVKIQAYNGTNWHPVKLDESTFSLVMLDHEHYEVHEGDHYFVQGFSDTNAGSILNFCMSTPNSATQVHVLFGLGSTGEVSWQWFEAPTFGTDGNGVTPRNNNRNFADASGMGIRLNPTITSSGTNISQGSFGVTGTPVSQSGGERRETNELILRTGTNYLFRINSFSNDNLLDYRGYWYEHTPETP